MRQKSGPVKEPAEKVVKDIRRATRRQFSAEEKIRIVLEGLRGEESIAELCRREGIVQNLYYRWSKDFLEAGKKRLAGDTARAATSDEVKDLRREAWGCPYFDRTIVLSSSLVIALPLIVVLSPSILLCTDAAHASMSHAPSRGKARRERTPPHWSFCAGRGGRPSGDESFATMSGHSAGAEFERPSHPN